ncbi:hypothetical protein [Xanthomonas phage XAJ2]|uniref:DUF2793 domain-containing protein n=1 Tax=Xanthomonas phage XAJ2 TaxID=1775249 RepID=A0A1I9L2F4_9CAUD|nr:hypothetical protein [Xanthomonas phage XAJ2]
MATTPVLGLELMESNSLQPSVPFNSAMQLLDIVAQLTVQQFLQTPPATTNADIGKTWIVSGGATGAWAGQDGRLAVSTAANLWRFIVPRAGWRADVQTAIYRFDGSTWNVVSSGGFYVPGFISGLSLSWVDAHTVRVSAGTAHNQSADLNYRQDAAANLTVPTTASTFFYLYQYQNNQLEVSTTAPFTTPYAGSAMSKGGDTTRRYLGAVLTDSSGNVVKFQHDGDEILYTEGIARLLPGGTSTTFAAISVGSQVPVGSKTVILAMTNGSATVPFRVRPIGYRNALNQRMYGLTGSAYVVGPVPLTSGLNIEYQVDSGGSGNIDIAGYKLYR